MSELTPEQAREHHLSRIREYAVKRDLSGEHIALIDLSGWHCCGGPAAA